MPMLGKKLIKRCSQGHEMQLAWRRCPRCTGRAGSGAAARPMTDETVVVDAALAPADETRVVPPSSRSGGESPVPVRARLAALAGPLAGQEIRVLAGRTKIGKAPLEEEGAVVIAVDDGYLSKEHAALEAGVGGVVLRDLGSTNGTFANGQRVDRAILRDGDELRMGQSVFRVVIPGQAR